MHPQPVRLAASRQYDDGVGELETTGPIRAVCTWLHRKCSCFSEIGVGLAGFGIAFLFLGVLLLFDKGLLAIGNVSVQGYIHQTIEWQVRRKLTHIDACVGHTSWCDLMWFLCDDCGLASLVGAVNTKIFVLILE